MSLFFRREAEERAESMQAWWGSGDNNPAGDALSVALSIVPVYAATALIADQLASSPWSVFQKSVGVPTKVASQPDLVVAPGLNDLDTYSWKYQAVTSLLLRGNAYGYIHAVDASGTPSRVEWLRPDKMVVDEAGPKPMYYFDGKLIDRSVLIHIPLYVVPGSVVGLSPISLFRTQIETGVEAQRATKNFFRRGGVPSSILRNTKSGLTADQAAETKRRFVASVSNSEPFVTGNDWDYTTVTVSSADASFLSGIKATATQIAAVYRVAPEDIGGETGGGSLTYKNLEQDQIRFNIRTLRPIATRIESVVNRYVLPNQYVRFNLDASVRADLKTRYESYAIAINGKFRPRDEVRALEELGPLTAADIDQFKELDSPASTIGPTS